MLELTFAAKVILLLKFMLITNPCNIPDIKNVECAEYRLTHHQNSVVIVCDTEYKQVNYELVFQQRRDGTWRLWELWEDDWPYLGKPTGLWNNIYKEAMTGIGKPDHCSVPRLNPNRHDN